MLRVIALESILLLLLVAVPEYFSLSVRGALGDAVAGRIPGMLVMANLIGILASLYFYFRAPPLEKQDRRRRCTTEDSNNIPSASFEGPALRSQSNRVRIPQAPSETQPPNPVKDFFLGLEFNPRFFDSEVEPDDLSRSPIRGLSSDRSAKYSGAEDKIGIDVKM